jgi:hypothetical protein
LQIPVCITVVNKIKMNCNGSKNQDVSDETLDSAGHEKSGHLKKRLNASLHDKNCDNCSPDSEDDVSDVASSSIGATSIKSATMNMITQASTIHQLFFCNYALFQKQ